MLRQFVDAARGRLRNGTLILLYHRVAELQRDPWSLSVTPAQFEQHLKVLRDRTCPISLNESGTDFGSGPFGKPRVAVTFDDGYSDNLHHAEPLLRAFGIPATMFVVSGAIRENREFWWDELERVVFEPNQPRNTDSPAAGHEPYAQLYTLLFSLMPDERRTMMNDLIEQSGLTSCARATHRPLSCAELVELSRSPVITIGAHTVSHPVLSGMPAGEQAEEVLQSKAELELLTGKPVLQFSYPYGKRGHYNTETMNIVRSAGFQYGFANEAGIATRSSDALQIPRVVVPALDGPEFSRWLSHCLATLP